MPINCIREVLKSKGKSQAWLAQELNISVSLVTIYTSNIRQPEIKTLYKMANLLDIDVRDLLSKAKVPVVFNED
jgi:putative transcriptional regulator